jgi:hypothetical protein
VDIFKGLGREVIGYIPPERYIDCRRPRHCRRDPHNDSKRRTQWDEAIRYGAIYDLSDDTTRPARPDEYENRNNLRTFPDDFKELMKVETGNWR